MMTKELNNQIKALRSRVEKRMHVEPCPGPLKVLLRDVSGLLGALEERMSYPGILKLAVTGPTRKLGLLTGAANEPDLVDCLLDMVIDAREEVEGVREMECEDCTDLSVQNQELCEEIEELKNRVWDLEIELSEKGK